MKGPLILSFALLIFSIAGNTRAVFVPPDKDIDVLSVEKTAIKSKIFSVSLNGKQLFTQSYKDINYVHVDHNSSVRLVVLSSEPISEFEVEPKNNLINATKKGNQLLLHLSAPGYHIISVNGKHRLFILSDRVLKSPVGEKQVVNVLKYGPDPTGKKLSTRQLQKAIDETSKARKLLYFPAGIYKTGTLKIGSHANIFLSAGSVIKGSENREDYPADGGRRESDHINDKQNYTDNGEWMTFSRLILIDSAVDVKIRGRGIIDGSGSVVRAQGKPANLIRIRNSRDVLIEGIVLRDPACWNTHILLSEDVTIRNVKMLNDRSVPNTDGFDPDASRRVLIENCFAYCSDDNVAIKTTNNGNLLGDVDDILIRNNVFLTKKSALKVGTETKGARMGNIRFLNNYIYEADRGLVLYCYDGALFENIRFEKNDFKWGLDTKNLKAIHFQIRDRSGRGRIKDVFIQDCRFAPTFSSAAEILGLDDNHQIDGVFFRNVWFGKKLLRSMDDLRAVTNTYVKNIHFEN
jgi:polygalacturonase